MSRKARSLVFLFRLAAACSAALSVAVVLVWAYPRVVGLSESPAAAQRDVAFRGVSLVNPGDPVSHDVTVLIRGGRFADVKLDSAELPNDIDVVTLEGVWMVPGLIDAHVHVIDEADLALLLAHGVTVARNMLGRPVHIAMRDAVSAGQLAGPRLLTAGPTLNSRAEAGSFHHEVPNPKAAFAAVQEIADRGYDLVKIYDDVDAPTYAALVTQSEKLGLPIAGHPPAAVPLEHLLSSLSSIEHVEEIWRNYLKGADDASIDRLASQFADSKVPLVVTLEAVGRLVDACGGGQVALEKLDSPMLNPLYRWFGERSLTGWVDDADPASCRRWRGHFGLMQRIVKRFEAQGVKLALGSDSGPHRMVHGKTTWIEMHRLHLAGLSPEEVLEAATQGSATALGIEHESGRIASGYRADALFLSSDPRVAVLLPSDIVGVLADGRWYDKNATNDLLDRGEHRHADWILTLGRLFQ